MYVLAREESAGVERRIPRQAKVLAVNLCRRLQADPRIAPRILVLRRRAFHRKSLGLVTP